VHGVLQLGRARPAARDRLRLADLVAETAEVARPQIERAGVTLEVCGGTGSGEREIRGDAALLSGALLNVLLNAAAASGAGSMVRIDVEHGEAVARVRVRDEGPGVPLAERDRIFEPFYTTKEGGTGLGLALAQRTVEEHGGTIRVADDAPGATFVIELPLAPGEYAS
jgi:signal transduction histidine kinase